MHEEHLGVRFWLGVFEIRSHLHGGEHVAQLLVAVHPPFADAVSCPGGAPELIQDALKFGCVVAQTGCGDRFWTTNNCPGLHQITNPSQNRERHVLTKRIEGENAISHATGGGEFAVFDRKEMHESIGIDVIKVVARGNLRTLRAKPGCDVRVFPVKIKDIGGETSLLQKITVARKVSHPGLCLFRPSLVTGEPLSKGAESKTWFFVEQRLVNRGVNDNSVKPHGEFVVCGW